MTSIHLTETFILSITRSGLYINNTKYLPQNCHMTKWSRIRNNNLKIIMSFLQMNVLQLNLSDLWILKNAC